MAREIKAPTQSSQLTSGRVMIIGANGLFTDDSALTFSGGTLNATTFAGGAALTGTPTAPTAAGGTNTTQIATTAFVQGILANAALTGIPTAPTAPNGTVSTQIANTIFANSVKKYNAVTYFGMDPTGTTDITSTFLSALTTIITAGGGELYFPSGSYRFNGCVLFPWITISGSQGNLGSLIISGDGCEKHNLLRPTSGTRFKFYDSTTPVAGEQAYWDIRGWGTIILRDFSMMNESASSTRNFIFVTNPVPVFERFAILGRTGRQWTTCDQDGIVFGGTQRSSDMTSNGVFFGYGGILKDCYFNRIRSIKFNTNVNSFFVAFNEWGIDCGGGATDAALVFDSGTEVGGSVGDSTSRGNVILANLFEMPGYKYGVKFKNFAPGNLAFMNGFWDASAYLGSTTYCYRIESEYTTLNFGFTYTDSCALIDDNGFPSSWRCIEGVQNRLGKVDCVGQLPLTVDSVSSLDQGIRLKIDAANMIRISTPAMDYLAITREVSGVATSWVEITRSSGGAESRFYLHPPSAGQTSYFYSSGSVALQCANGYGAFFGDITNADAFKYISGNLYTKAGIPLNLGAGVAIQGTGTAKGAINDYDKAQAGMSGGGIITWAGSGGKLKWTGSFSTNIPSASGSDQYITMTQPTSNISASDVYNGVARTCDANGVVLGTNPLESLYAVHTVGGNNTAITYKIVSQVTTFVAPSNWILIASINSTDDTIKLGTGDIIPAGGTIAHHAAYIYKTGIGPSNSQLHTIPAVTSDTLALLNAQQDLLGKSFSKLSTTVPPWKFTTGSALVTTPVLGAAEFDGYAFFLTPNTATGYAVNEVTHLVCESASRTGSDVNTAQSWFTSSRDTLTLQAFTTYMIEGMLVISRTAGTTSHTLGIGFGGTVAMSADYIAEVSQVANTPTTGMAVAMNWIQTYADTTVTTASTSATEQIVIKIRGVIRTGTAGTFIPQFKYSAAPGGAPTIARSTFFRISPIGVDSMNSVGLWA